MKLGLKLDLRSVGTKLFLVVFLAIVVLSAGLGLVSYQVSKGIIQEQVSSASSEAVKQAADKLDFLFGQYESQSRQLAVDPILRSDLETVNMPDLGTVERTQAEDRIRRRLDALTGSDDRLVSVKLIASAEGSTSTIQSGSTGVRTDEAIEARLKQIKEADGEPVWIPTLSKGFFGNISVPEFTMGRLLKNMQHPEAEYILLIEIKESSLGTILSNLKIGNSGEVRLVTASNQIVHAKDSKLLEKESFIKVSPAQLKGKDRSFTAENEQNVENLVVFQPLMTSGWTLLGYAPTSDFLSAADRLLTITFTVIVVAIILALLIGYYMIRMVGKPLSKLSKLMEEGERGNLKVRAAFKSNDEIGRVGQAFNQMMTRISALVEQTNSTALKVLGTAEELAAASKSTSQAAGEIAAATHEIAQGTSNLAIEAEKESQIADDIGAKMDKVNAANVSMGESADRAIAVSVQGTEYMKELVDKTGTASKMTDLIQENSAKLTRSTASIQSILAPMVEMTKQTNILSLNASIEAARAGAAGRGFSIIADEIRTLAQQSNESIQSVSNITNQIQQDIEHTVEVLNKVSPLFDEQLESVREASSFFTSVREEMEQFYSHIENSSGSVKELSDSQYILGDSISSVSAVVEETSASTQQVASMSSEQFKVSEQLVALSVQLERLAEDLKKSLTGFNT
ncbi:methyl-accepting chemotaxis protein [Paenibacillus sp. YPG26]|uniref:methyl-accepting chemotaxis protein n=1 Tax=Paenibacillus sp. YPG26 TaxID=2878915 RepID=UPI0020402E85|nr:methyl-accepting chemotaxis protein [Paenibacillus sp. YPG26]USB33675.1 methyl-accepting chemotaxis protein [Paenibacillus sp. YPG26]